MIKKGIINKVESKQQPISLGHQIYKPQKLTEMEPKDVNKKLSGYDAIRKKVLEQPTKTTDPKKQPLGVIKPSESFAKQNKQKINLGL